MNNNALLERIEQWRESPTLFSAVDLIADLETALRTPAPASGAVGELVKELASTKALLAITEAQLQNALERIAGPEDKKESSRRIVAGSGGTLGFDKKKKEESLLPSDFKLRAVYNSEYGQWKLCHNQWCKPGETSVVGIILISEDAKQDEKWAKEIERRFNNA